MKTAIAVTFLVMVALQADAAEKRWYTGDERCPPPRDDGTYSEPYNPLEHPQDYPVFAEADKSGWSCSYQRGDGVLVQFGDSRTPQQQWLSLWGGSDNN